MKYTLLLILMIFQAGCSNGRTADNKADSSKGLKDHYNNYFPVGVSVAVNNLTGEESTLIVKEFNSITAENAMKMKRLQPKENEFNWKDADSIISFAKHHKMKVRGHTLVWHEETPDWLWKDVNGNTASKELVLSRLKKHITEVITRYKGSVYAWDVVNEAISNDPAELYRKSKLFEICGEEFISKAFEYAHAADSSALLFYNDFNETDPVKRSKIISLIKRLKANGVPIHGIGLQAHWSAEDINKKDLESTLQDFSRLGLQIQITELDLSIYPKNAKSYKLQEFNKETKEKQSRQYKMIFSLLRKYKQYITGVTFWNVSDRKSWLDNFPVKGRKDYPLLFDENLKPKKAYWEVALFGDK